MGACSIAIDCSLNFKNWKDKETANKKGEGIAVVHRTNDNDDKLIIVPERKKFSDEQIEALIEYQERFFEHIIIRI